MTHAHEPSRKVDGHAAPTAAPRRETSAVPVPSVVFLSDVPELQRSLGNAVVARMLTARRRQKDQTDEQAPASAVGDVLTSPGKPLEEPVRREMESRIGADFSDVRLHTDSTAHTAAESVRADAFTSGRHIVFQRGRYDTTSAAGKHMLAHELTHVVQQRSGPVAGTDTGDGLRVSHPSDAFERAAEATATRVMNDPVPEEDEFRGA
ncbi:eCIS core domain-containing protein [Amycolatopsis pigmentata]|uniref:DUF4157 domain-containing protein n=1 Tax=Amycolatopsis pigmentata TaxID=450801 RepID=A0ABW5FMW4_9PSEU